MNQHAGVEICLPQSTVGQAGLPIRNVVQWYSPKEVPSDPTIAICALPDPPSDRRGRGSRESDSDSDSDTDGSSPRRVRSRRHYDKYLPLAPAGTVYANPPNRPRSIGLLRSRSQVPRGSSRRYDSGSDSSSDDDDDDGGGGKKKAQPKPPPKHILYTGLACVATLAAANNIYQSAKAHHTRQRELDKGEISSAEAQKLKTQARKMDLISLGVAAVGAYNVRNGWRRAEGHWKAHREKQAEERR